MTDDWVQKQQRKEDRGQGRSEKSRKREALNKKRIEQLWVAIALWELTCFASCCCVDRMERIGPFYLSGLHFGAFSPGYVSQCWEISNVSEAFPADARRRHLGREAGHVRSAECGEGRRNGLYWFLTLSQSCGMNYWRGVGIVGSCKSHCPDTTCGFELAETPRDVHPWCTDCPYAFCALECEKW